MKYFLFYTSKLIDCLLQRGHSALWFQLFQGWPWLLIGFPIWPLIYYSWSSYPFSLPLLRSWLFSFLSLEQTIPSSIFNHNGSFIFFCTLVVHIFYPSTIFSDPNKSHQRRPHSHNVPRGFCFPSWKKSILHQFLCWESELSRLPFLYSVLFPIVFNLSLWPLSCRGWCSLNLSFFGFCWINGGPSFFWLQHRVVVCFHSE